MKAIMTKTVEMRGITLYGKQSIEVTPHKTLLNVFYVTGQPETELLINEPQVFVEVKEQAA